MNSSDKRILASAFYALTGSSYEGIRGVLCHDSGIDGPCVGITINTHANEPSGLIMMWNLLFQFGLPQRMQKGKIFFVTIDLLASAKELLKVAR